MQKYHRYSVALNDEEQYRFVELKKQKIGIKKIFMEGLERLSPTVKEVVTDGEEI